jgi:hypothetical protein
VAKILGPAPEHWVEFLVDGPKGFQETVRLVLRSPRVHLLKETDPTYAQLMMRAIIKAKRLNGLNCWPSKRFTTHARDWSDSVDKYNQHP